MNTQVTQRPLYRIAIEIKNDWKDKKGYSNIYFGAKPYLEAMGALNNISEDYGLDSGSSIVAYFLANAATWRGDTARRVKSELKAMLKAHNGR